MITMKEAAEAFEAWEKGVRISPQNYRSTDEVKLLSVSQVSKERAEYFLALLEQQKNG